MYNYLTNIIYYFNILYYKFFSIISTERVSPTLIVNIYIYPNFSLNYLSYV